MSNCPLCGAATQPVLRRQAVRSHRAFDLAECRACRFVHVVDPRTDFDELYGPAYYAGEGVDPSVAYSEEMDDPSSARAHEWNGVIRAVRGLGVEPPARWLDFGCGLGGLVRVARTAGYQAVGFESGWAADELERRGIEHLDAAGLDSLSGYFDVVTAVEVLEHMIDPVEELRTIRRMLRPGGVLFVTTGNLDAFRARLERWSYVLPDVHVSYFSPHALGVALRTAGFECGPSPGRTGFDGIVRYRVLAALGARRDRPVHRLVPWKLVAEVVDRRYGLSRHPVGLVPTGSSHHETGNAADGAPS